ncbi:MAG TPA: lysophospholipid acyltransferase family protein [Candidatus Kapabacteria bacterium]|nr:lysophospholipid acyltransferase family protein [Candidatus Kapabacteria bacterium]
MSQDEILRVAAAIQLDRSRADDGASHILAKNAFEILRTPLPAVGHTERLIIRFGTLFSRDLLVDIQGLHHIASANDPFILAANHNQRLEALVVPMWLSYLRGGEIIRFMADWNFLLIPGIASLLRRGQTIPVTAKPARPKFLNMFKPFLVRSATGFEAAKEAIAAGKSIGIFPEGTVNSDPTMLLRGHIGAARLSIQTGAPIVPMGISFPFHNGSKRIPEFAKMSIAIGCPVYPPQLALGERADTSYEQTLHAIMMQNIAELSHKHWNPLSKRGTHHVHQ